MQQTLPLIVIVGRPNVGKSTLFNRLIGQRRALVHDLPGVTRDSLGGIMNHQGRSARLIDTGGLDERPDDVMGALVTQRGEAAIARADFLLLVVDRQAGILPADLDIVKRLRRSGKPWALIVNKTDVVRHTETIVEFARLGAKETFAVSAEHGPGIQTLLGWLQDTLEWPESPPDLRPRRLVVKKQTAEALAMEEVSLSSNDESSSYAGEDAESEWPDVPDPEMGADIPIRVALIGRPNGGKSSLVNALIGEDRHLVSDLAGTTRDAVDSPFTREGQAYVLVDTAGLRRQRSIKERIEHLTAHMTKRHIANCDVVALVLDGAIPPAEQDAKIASLAHEAGRGVVVVVNKWDLATNPEWRENYLYQLGKEMPFLTYAPIVTCSAKSHAGLGNFLKQVRKVQEARMRRITTGELNRFVRKVVEAHPPPHEHGRRPQFLFVSQPLVGPPTFVFSTRGGGDIQVSYRRYLTNAIRDSYDFVGTPIWLKFRPHNQKRA